MTDNIPALIAEARAFADRDNGLNWQGRIRELADALEATVKEMHARELHHFEAEQAMREALELIQPGQFARPDMPGYAGTTRDVVSARAILTRALNEGETDE